MIKHLINLVDPDHESDYEGGLYSNLFTAHPPFQIDANFGYATFFAHVMSTINFAPHCKASSSSNLHTEFTKQEFIEYNAIQILRALVSKRRLRDTRKSITD